MEKLQLVKCRTFCLDERGMSMVVGWLVSITALSDLNKTFLGKWY